ncbi:endonuclease/exonuclease/phosphatase family protein [Streptosporangium sp. 'caverna']|uniref:endonuclease/exonuclease/phosphatase family protein n=1 Tax=Streptosporangium sp. 'caverna' TaxID=2202249 RepID=UPI000D7DFF0C|nr:endonuclease/exonuclease/phosphatase family protein [Streptosporangium sp. 'caverna']AWS43107.1 endonuclease [Streptosporangium sp. 'caverna']
MRVLTWNVWWRFGPWQARRQAIAATLGELDCDLIGLQEVWAEGQENLAGWLADRLGMHWAWTASDRPGRWHDRLGDTTADVGDAVLSRWPIIDSATLRLPAAGGRDDGHQALHTLVDAPTRPVAFFTTHLNSAPHESAVRCAQVTALARFIAAHQDGTAFPVVVTGDYNALPDSDEMRLLGGYRTAPAVPGQVLLDAWEYADPAAPAATWDPANPHAAQIHEPPGRIDYIHVGPPGPGGLGHIRSVRRAGDRPVDGVWPSDHAAVLADLATRADHE